MKDFEMYCRGKSIISGNVATKRWVEGYYIKHLTVTPAVLWRSEEDRLKFIEEHTEHKIAFDDFSDWNMPRGIKVIDIDPKTLGRFTGMYDKKKRRIYEGDIIVDDKGRELVVLWKNYSWKVKAIKNTYFKFADLIEWENDCEVISNIHDREEVSEDVNT